MIPCLRHTRLLKPFKKVLSPKIPGAALGCDNVRHCSEAAHHTSDEYGLVYQKLSHRALLQVTGTDSANFLQGLLTNDMTLLDGPMDAMYSLVLNVQGRVLYDLIVYNKSPKGEKPSYLVECESQVASEFLSMMKKYKIRKKVNLFDVSDTYKVWSVMPEDADVSMETLPIRLTTAEPVVCSVRDPRLAAFSHRLILLQGIPASQVLEKAVETSDEDFYRRRRFRLGIGEGTTDLPPANSFPLECNAAFLNGVSFSKGCYIGQELTARTHHTGVIRKRLMPFTFASSDHGAQTGDRVENVKGKNCGKIRDFVGKDGLALLRVAETVGKRVLSVQGEDGQKRTEGSTHIPPWWPVETDEIMRQVVGKK